MKTNIERIADMKKETDKECNKIKKQNAKLRNNAVCGKSIENAINQVDVKVVATRKQYLK